MKLLWIVLCLMPFSFFIASYDYANRPDGGTDEGNLFLFCVIPFVISIIIGFLSKDAKIKILILFNIVSCILSLFLAALFLHDTYYFTMIGREGYIIALSLIIFLVQFFARTYANSEVR